MYAKATVKARGLKISPCHMVRHILKLIKEERLRHFQLFLLMYDRGNTTTKVIILTENDNISETRGTSDCICQLELNTLRIDINPSWLQPTYGV